MGKIQEAAKKGMKVLKGGEKAVNKTLKNYGDSAKRRYRNAGKIKGTELTKYHVERTLHGAAKGFGTQLATHFIHKTIGFPFPSPTRSDYGLAAEMGAAYGLLHGIHHRAVEQNKRSVKAVLVKNKRKKTLRERAKRNGQKT